MLSVLCAGVLIAQARWALVSYWNGPGSAISGRP